MPIYPVNHPSISAQDIASRDYPAMILSTGERLHVFKDEDGWHVWLNTEMVDFDGICVASAESRSEAVLQALNVFNVAAFTLRWLKP